MSVATLRMRYAREFAQLKTRLITVLAGGGSAEREVALVSGRAVYDALSAAGYRVALLAVTSNGLEFELQASAGLEQFPMCGNETTSADGMRSVLPALSKAGMVFTTMHGTFGEDGVWQGLLELADLPYVSAGVKGSAVAMDKLTTKRLFQQLGIPTPRYWVIRNQQGCRQEVPKNICGLVAKPVNQGSSVGIALVENNDAGWEEVMSLAERFDPLLVEERIYGRELTAAVIGPADEPVALPLVEITPQREFYDYTAKYTKGGSIYTCPAQLNENTAWLVQQHATMIFREFELTPYARIDCILDSEGVPWFIEANTLPGFTPLSLLPMAAKAAGLEFGELAELLMAIALERFAARRDK